MQHTMYDIRNVKDERRATSDERIGSALILTLVLTSLLAIVGVLFLMMARLNKITASSISKNKELDSAVDTVIAKISESLIQDVPGVAGAEYYDYPDVDHAWLASLEPYQSGTDPNYYWRQISDVTGFLASKGFQTTGVNVDPPGNQQVIREYPDITLTNGQLDEQLADADGDGIADSKWIQLDNITSSSGEPIYAAIRIIDNSGMVNINTAYNFDPNDPCIAHIDGSTQMQINLAGLLKTGSLQPNDTIDNLHKTRCGSGASDWGSFSQNVIWQYGFPNGNYTPFDISDELELRYRYCIDSQFKSRFEANLPNTAKTYGNPGSLYDGSSNWGLSDWQGRIPGPNYIDRRHLLTIYNMDRIIDPNGNKMTNINTADVNTLYNRIFQSLLDANPAYPNANGVAAQIAVNIIDYRDSNSNITSFVDPNGTTYYGFQRPCIYISELAHKFVTDANGNVYRSYAIELYKPDSNDNSPVGWRLLVGGVPISIDNWSSGQHFYVVLNQDANAPFGSIPMGDAYINLNPSAFTFDSNGNTDVNLQRPLPGGGYIIVDSKQVPAASVGWLADDNQPHSVQRDITLHKCIRRLWDPNTTGSGSPTLGSMNSYTSPDANLIQAHPANKPFTNVGEIGMIFVKSAYSQGPNPIGPNDTEATVRINLADLNFQQVFKYLTVFDPNNYGWPASETRVEGRININTAPWYVLAQLPWVSQRKGSYNNTALAQAIVAYRDKTAVSGGDPNYSNRLGAAGFESIGQLCDVNLGSDLNFGIDYYSRGIMTGDQIGPPDIDELSGDGAPDDFEERDLIFARISNLVTVRSDVFTAYILVRIGTDGPQKRVIAIFDRSNVKSSADGRMRVLAVQPVADPR